MHKAAGPTDREILTAVEGGAFGIMLKESAPETLIACLQALMPADAVLEGEIQIYARDVAFVRPGDRCNMKLDAFNFVQWLDRLLAFPAHAGMNRLMRSAPLGNEAAAKANGAKRVCIPNRSTKRPEPSTSKGSPGSATARNGAPDARDASV